MRRLHRSSHLLAAAGLAILAACGGDSTGPAARSVESVAVTPATFSLYLGGMRTLTASAADGADSVIADATFTWSASAPGVATVSPSGLVTAVGVGVDTIRATSDGVIGEAVLTVTAVPVDTVVVTPTTATVHMTLTKQLTASPRDSAGGVLAGRAIVWASSDSAKAMVSPTGLVTGIAVGVVTITATSEGRHGGATVTVDSIPVATVQLVPAGDTVQVGDTISPVAVPRDSSGNVIPGLPTTWGVTDSSVLQPIAGQKFVVLADGAVTLSATIRSVTKTGAVLAQSCGDTLQVATGSFTFPLITGGLATDVGATVDIGLFKGNAAWYGGGVMYGTDSAHMVVAYDPSLNLARGVAKGGNCLATSDGLYHRTYSKVKPAAGLTGPSGLRVVQESFTSTSTSADEAFVLFRYTFTNTTGIAIPGVRSGFVVDWDLGNDPSANLLTYRAADAVHAAVESDSLVHTERLGVIGFSAVGSRTSNGWLNGADPSTRGAYYTLLGGGTSTATSGPMDIRAMAGVSNFSVPAYGRVVIYFAVIGGTNSAKFTTSLAAAKALANSLGYN